MSYVLCVLLLCGASAAQAMQGLFYQPQLRDMNITSERWEEAMAAVRQYGFDTLVVQWTRYGEALAGPAHADWLQQRLLQARAAGLQLVLGLYADPEFFQRVEGQSPGELQAYLGQLEAATEVQAKDWEQRLGGAAIAGWYLPAEIDDANWRSAARQALAQTYLEQTQADLISVLNRPVYLTSFFTGKMTPQAYRGMLEGLSRTGVHVWVQTGEGTGVLRPLERQLYLDSLTPCAGVASGLVRELFVQQGTPESSFLATSLAKDLQMNMLASASSCGTDRVFFSLRYLPGMEDIRDGKGVAKVAEQ